MRHARYDVHRLDLDGVDLPLAYGDLLVAEQDGNPTLQWELQVVLLGAEGPAPVGPGRQPSEVSLRLLDGRTVVGTAFLVRSSERMHVFRGLLPLDGIDAAELA